MSSGDNQAGPTRAERVLLAIMALTTFGFGCAYLVAPLTMAAESGLAITRPAAMAELRGYYGGLQMGMGVLFALAYRSAPWTRVGLGAAAVLFAGNGLGRLVGVLVAQSLDRFNASGLVFEAAFSITACALLRARGRSTSSREDR